MTPISLQLSSSAFQHNGLLPAKYTCDGDGAIPPLAWSGDIPDNVRGFALIMDDPDAVGGLFVHWVTWNIPVDVRSIAENSMPPGRAGKNSGGQAGYYPPCPPSGTHRYVFRLYALDTELELDDGANRAELLTAMNGHIVASAELIGRYSRSS